MTSEYGVCLDLRRVLRIENGDWSSAPILTASSGLQVVFRIYSECIKKRLGFVFDIHHRKTQRSSTSGRRLVVGPLYRMLKTGTLHEKVMTEAHSSPFTIHQVSTTDVRDLKRLLVERIKQTLEIPVWEIGMSFHGFRYRITRKSLGTRLKVQATAFILKPMVSQERDHSDFGNMIIEGLSLDHGQAAPFELLYGICQNITGTTVKKPGNKRTQRRMSDHEAKENQASAFCSQPQLYHCQNQSPAPLIYNSRD
ncbi:hypothetical protein Tco_1577488 [Tanacetum coccineum]